MITFFLKHAGRIFFLTYFIFLPFFSDGTNTTVTLNSVYHQLKGAEKPDFSLFETAYLGYIDLKLSGLLPSNKNVLSIVDFRIPSHKKRLWVVDLEAKVILFHTYVAHGVKSGEEYAMDFSNTIGSHQSSLGFYVTQETYIGKNGLSLKLEGLERGFNSNAKRRYIVLHGAKYATEEYLKKNGRLGFSEGCPAVPMNISKPLIEVTKEGTCLFVYFPDSNYLDNSSYISELN